MLLKARFIYYISLASPHQILKGLVHNRHKIKGCWLIVLSDILISAATLFSTFTFMPSDWICKLLIYIHNLVNSTNSIQSSYYVQLQPDGNTKKHYRWITDHYKEEVLLLLLSIIRKQISQVGLKTNAQHLPDHHQLISLWCEGHSFEPFGDGFYVWISNDFRVIRSIKEKN